MTDFEKNLTQTLKLKGIKHLKDLSKHYTSLTEALDSTHSELGYEKAKGLTLRFKKRDADFGELMKLWAEPATSATVSTESETLPAAMKQEVGDEIKSDLDLVVVLSAHIQERFGNPETGFWVKYDSQFDGNKYTALGKEGWQTAEPSDSKREAINRLKNEEVHRILGTEFTKAVVKEVFEVMITQVFGVRKREITLAVRNHVRGHLYKLIYGQK